MSDDLSDNPYLLTLASLERLEAERYTYENGVLRNLRGITDPSDYRGFEFIEVQAQTAMRPHIERYSSDELRAIHGRLFQNVWEWTGLVYNAQRLSLRGFQRSRKARRVLVIRFFCQKTLNFQSLESSALSYSC